jgi:4-amino-4-deoxy-L-arabinose transferase-like glycosyltransferase
LGAVLGLGYLAKAPMFPLSVLFFVLLFIYRRPATDRKQLLVGFACFLVVATPFITALSLSKGRFTIGDSGMLNYAWHVNRKPLAHWRGDPGQSLAKHPTRQIADHPAVYEFAEPINATYPVSYDPSYWEEGLSPHFQLWLQLAAIKNNSIVLLKMLIQSAPLWIALAILFSVGSSVGSRGQPSKSDIAFGFLVLSAASVGMFLLVHLEPRYIAPFVVIAVLVLFGWLKLPNTHRSRTFFSATTLALFALLCVYEVSSTYAEIQNAASEGHEHLAVAKALNDMGLHSGDKVGNIGDSYIAYWARLARVSIVTEIPQPEADRFWHSDPVTQQERLDAMVRAGAKIVLTDYPDFKSSSWHKLEGTHHYFFRAQ